MSKEYYLIPKEIIDSRIEKLNKISKESFNDSVYDTDVEGFISTELQSLKQQSELVEVEDYKLNIYVTMCKWFGKGILAKTENRISELKPTNKFNTEDYKLIKTITK